MEFELGHTYSGYKILDIVKRSRSAVQYRVQNTLAQRVERLCTFTGAAGEDSEAAERFLREVRIRARLCHPNILAFYTAVPIEGRMAMTTELPDSVSLADRLLTGALGWPEALDVTQQLLDALNCLHLQSFVHCDVTPESILFAEGGFCKLADFSHARPMDPSQDAESGAVVGNPRYISPEQVKGECALDQRSDLYSLGIVLYEMLCGRPPFESRSQFELMMAHVHQPPAAPSAVNPKVPPGLDAVVMKALSKAREDRYQSVAEFAGAIARFSSEENAVVAPMPEVAAVGNAEPVAIAVVAPLAEPEPIAVAQPEAVPEPEALAVAEPEITAIAEPEVVGIAEPEPIVVAQPEAVPEAEVVAVAEPEITAITEPEVVAIAEPEPIAVAQPEAVPEPDVLAVAEPEITAITEPEVVAIAEPEPIGVPQPAVPEPEVLAVAEPEITTIAEPEVVAIAEPEPIAVAQPAVPEPEALAVAEPEITAIAEPEVVGIAEPEPIAVAQPEISPFADPEPVAVAEPKPVAAAITEPEVADVAQPQPGVCLPLPVSHSDLPQNPATTREAAPPTVEERPSPIPGTEHQITPWAAAAMVSAAASANVVQPSPIGPGRLPLAAIPETPAPEPQSPPAFEPERDVVSMPAFMTTLRNAPGPAQWAVFGGTTAFLGVIWAVIWFAVGK